MKKVNLLAAAVLAAAFAMPAQANYTPNAYFGGYFRSGVMNKHFNKSDSTVQHLGRLGAENDTYAEVMLGADVATVDDTVWTINSRFSMSSQYNRDWQSTDNYNAIRNSNGALTDYANDDVEGTRFAFREFNLQVKGLMDWDKDAVVWSGKRFYHREDIHITDFYYHDISGMGAGVENLTAGPGKLSLAWMRRDDGGSYVSRQDESKSLSGANSSVHLIDVQYDLPAWDGANIELRDTYLIPQRNSDSGIKKNYKASADYGVGNIFDFELNQGYSLGWNKTVLQWVHGSNANYAAFGNPIWLDTTGASDSANRYTFINFGETHFTENLGMFHVVYASYSDNYDNSLTTKKNDKAFQFVVRPYYRLTKMTRLYFEGGFFTQSSKSYKAIGSSQTASDNTQGQKYTLAYAITPDAGNFWSRPELRFYVSYLHTNGKFNISQWGNSEKNGWESTTTTTYPGDTTQNRQWLFGVQAEAWW